MEELKRYIIHLPQSLAYREERKVKVNLYKALYYAITGQGKYLDLLFSSVPEEEVVALQGYAWPPKLNRSRPFYKYVASAKYTHPAGQSCGRVLEENEPVYRCDDCGYDDTCVLCVHCFNRDDHIDHNVRVYMARGDGGGICDCGDETAFLTKLNCACQNVDEEGEALPEEFRILIRETLTVVLNYIIDVSNFSINTLPVIHRNINNRGDLQVTSKSISDFCSLPTEVYGAIDENSDDIWHLVLWNDENHDYLEAETGIRAATGVSDQRAKEIASDINSNGRAILKTSKLYVDLLKGQKLAEADGLVATIMSARDYMREVVVLQMFNWLGDVLGFSGNSAFREESKIILAELFLEPNYEVSKVIPVEFFHTKHLDLHKEFFRNGLLYNSEILNLAPTKLKPGVSSSSLSKSCHEIFRPPTENDIAGSRIQHLLIFEIRLVSLVRKKFSQVILPVFFTDAKIKATFCEQYLDILPLALTVLALSDREEQLSSTTSISSQLFTCPRTNKWVVQSGKLGNILGPLSTLIEEHSSKVNSTGFPYIVDIVVDVRSKREKSSIQRSITETVDSLSKIVCKNDDVDILNEFIKHDNLVMLLNLLKYFQGSSPIVRKTGDHVERELVEEFFSYLQRSLPVLSIAQFAGKVSQIDVNHAVTATRSIVEFFSLLDMKCSAEGIAAFSVSKDPVSFLNPINAFLSYILQECGIDNVKGVLVDSPKPFMFISDISLRSIVLASQVKIGFWIRNGVTVTRQASYYVDIQADVSYFRDFFLNQVACVFDDPKTTLLNFLDRWELLHWFAGDVNEKNTVYEDRFGFICEQFILFMYNLLTDRFYFDKDMSKEGLMLRAKKAICYALCGEPKSYSSLKAELGHSTTNLPEFDDLLRECAEYSPPTGLYDFGVYRLKPELYEKLDPLSLHLDSSEFLSIAESLTTNIAKNKKVDEKKVVLFPEISACKSSFVNSNIGRFTRTKEFAKLIYKLLQVALNSLDELFLPHLLHLVHAVLIDDEMINGSSHLAEYFVAIPISDLLLSIAESTMSASIILKADFLLDQFVTKDNRIMESLIDCFGEDHVQSYKKRKVGLFETEADKRKRLAEERKERVMKKFARQREKFIQQNELHETHGDDAADETESDLRKCVACGETESHDELFVILLCKTMSSIFWKVPPQGPYLQLAFGDLDSRPQPAPGKVYPPGYDYDLMTASRMLRITSQVASSCAHGMHLKCYSRAQTMKSFSCPLCHNLHDSFILTFMLDATFSVDAAVLCNEPISPSYEEILCGSVGLKLEDFAELMIEERSLLNDKIIKECFENEVLDESCFYTKTIDLALLVADTVKSNEIASRIDGTKGLSTFVETFPTPVKVLIWLMMQSWIFIHNIKKKNDLELDLTNEILKGSLSLFEFPDGVFDEVIRLFFQTRESLRTCMRLGLAKLIAVAAYTLLQDYESLLNGPLLNSHKLENDLIERLDTFVTRFVHQDSESILRSGKRSELFLPNLYFAMERLLLPYLRQCVIFYDILTCRKGVQSEFESVDGIKSLKSQIESQEYLDSHEALCNFLDLPTLRNFIDGIILGNEALTYEIGVFEFHIHSKIDAWKKEGNPIRLDYPGVIRLIDLPDDYNACVTDPQYKSSNEDSICLQCGTYLDTMGHVAHIRRCSHMPIYFLPRLNSLNVVIHINGIALEVTIPAPYLTVHGEIKRDRLPGKATLNRYRFDYLNKLWLNQGLFGFLARTLFGTRGNAGGVPIAADLTDIEQDMDFDDASDEFEFWE